MTAIATSGFSVTDASFGEYDRRLQVAAMLIMVAGAVSFVHYRGAIRKRNPLTIFCRGPVVLFLAGVIVATALVWLAQLTFDTDGGLYVALFQIVTAFATVGFSAVDLSDWHSAPLAVLVLCMLFGGQVGPPQVASRWIVSCYYGATVTRSISHRDVIGNTNQSER